MPNRIIKDSIRTSKTVNAMTDFQFRVWVYLITYVDDYGRGSADPELIKGFVFPRRKRLSESDIEKTLAELAGMGCISLYDVDGESYFYFPNWGAHQRIQNKKSKYPAPDCENSRLLTVTHGEPPPESESESKYESKSNSPPTPPDIDWGFGEELTCAFSDWLRYKREKRQDYKPTGLQSLVTKVRNKSQAYGESAVSQLIRECMAANWQGIIWDKLERKNQTGQSSSGQKSWVELAREMEGTV